MGGNETLKAKFCIYIYDERVIGPRWVVWAPRWASINRGRPYSVPASVTFVLEQQPRLIGIN
jgi:hypothetical protein